jgi:hypothetical protein
VPEAPDVTVIHDAPLVAVHVQPPVVVTDTLPFEPFAGTETLVGAIEYVQPVA